MVDLFITDDPLEYEKMGNDAKLLYRDGYIDKCSFIEKEKLEKFNESAIVLEDQASKVMLRQLDEDTNILKKEATFNTNRFISRLGPEERIHSMLFKFYAHFVVNKCRFQLVMDSFFSWFGLSVVPLVLSLSEDYYLTQNVSYSIKSAKYRSELKMTRTQFFKKQLYYFFRKHIPSKKKIKKTHLAIFLFDAHNMFDVYSRLAEIVNKQDEILLTFVVMDSGNPKGTRVDTKQYEGKSVQVIELHEKKANLITDYSDFYKTCVSLNPAYSIFKKAGLCEWEDIQYAFVNEVIKALEPKICIYSDTQERGRVLANVSAAYAIPSMCVDYSLFFDTYKIERRIKFDIRACISEVAVFNWKKHKDPTPKMEITGFCKIDNWTELLQAKESGKQKRLFDNDNRTILFLSTWAPNPHSPLLTEKIKIVRQLSEMCARNNWNLIVKKHPSEFDGLLDHIFDDGENKNQKLFEHKDMTLFDCIYYADFVCTQNSTSFVEALYQEKPFSYLTITDENAWADISYFSKEKEVGTFKSISEYEQYISLNTSQDNYSALVAEFKKLQAKYIYKADGKASERLFDLIRSQIQM